MGHPVHDFRISLAAGRSRESYVTIIEMRACLLTHSTRPRNRMANIVKREESDRYIRLIPEIQP